MVYKWNSSRLIEYQSISMVERYELKSSPRFIWKFTSLIFEKLQEAYQKQDFYLADENPSSQWEDVAPIPMKWLSLLAYGRERLDDLLPDAQWHPTG